MFSTFDLCLLLYVIRLAGWLKHCNLSLSLSAFMVCNRPSTESVQMNAGISHAFMQSAEAFLPVFCLCFLLQKSKLNDLAARMLLSVVRRHIKWQYGLL